jgi:hypothetical protein
VGTFDWKFDLQGEQASRLPNLHKSVQFLEIIEGIAADMTILCCHPSAVLGSDISRVVYCVQVEQELFDLFFNSSNGYRAAYFRSQGEGIDANANFFEIVTPKLLSNSLSNNCGLDREFLQQSLRTPSAKVWLAEHEKEVEKDCVGCQGEWSSGSVKDIDKPEILNGVWERPDRIKAKWGCKAPFLTKLRIMGAFLDGQLNEWIPSDKRFRAKEIHELGWS